MATISGLIDRVRVELGDLGKSFVTQFTADGTTNRFRLHYAPLDGTTVEVFASIAGGSSVNITADSAVEESTGILVVTLTFEDYPDFVNEGEDVPKAGVDFSVSGTYYRYFTGAELTSLINDAVAQHTAKRTDTVGRKFALDTLPMSEEYPVALYATTLALYTLATDASFDIDIMAPDGVSIPRSERYRQLMEMIQARQAQYKELCALLGIGLYSIDVFTFRRISKMTNRYVPVYKPMEVDDRSFPQRAYLPEPTYGDQRPAFPTEDGELTAYQGRAYTAEIPFSGDFTDKSFVAKLVQQRGSVQTVQNFELDVLDNEDGTFVATISLTSDQTYRLANRTWWRIESVDDITDEHLVIVEGNFFTIRASEVIL